MELTDINFQLLNAAECGRLSNVKLLIDQGACITDEIYESALTKNHVDCAQFLLKNSDIFVDTEDFAGRTLLFVAAIQERPDIIEWCVQRGANINHVISNNRTPLLAMVWRNNIPMTKCLLEYGADITCHDGGNKNVFQVAKDRGSEEMLNFLNCFIEYKELNVDNKENYINNISF